MADKKSDPEPKAQAPAPADVAAPEPGMTAEPAAPAGAEPTSTPGFAPPGQGAQVVLTGDAQDAARGGTHGDIVANTAARDEAIVAGHIEPATAAAAADATSVGVTDDIDAAEAEAMAKLRADFAAKRVARAAKPA